MEGRTMLWFVHLFLANHFFKFTICNPCNFSPSLIIVVPLWYTVIALVFFHFHKLSFSDSLQLKGNFAHGQNSSKCHELLEHHFYWSMLLFHLSCLIDWFWFLQQVKQNASVIMRFNNYEFVFLFVGYRSGERKRPEGTRDKNKASAGNNMKFLPV